MPTNAQILQYAPGASYLAANAVRKSGLFDNQGRINPLLPQQIYALYFVIKKIYDIDPNYSGMTAVCLYLWEMMGRYGIQAQGLSGGGGNVPGPTPNQDYPIYLTQANFTTATFYPNANIFGTNIAIYLNEINRYLDPATEFSVSSTGVTILIPGFDATINTYTLIIEKVYPA